MIPKRTRRLVLHRARWLCEDCGKFATLEMHHRHYETVGNEKPEDLAALCRECHKARHVDRAGNWWNDPQEREVYWATYWSELAKD